MYNESHYNTKELANMKIDIKDYAAFSLEFRSYFEPSGSHLQLTQTSIHETSY